MKVSIHKRLQLGSPKYKAGMLTLQTLYLITVLCYILLVLVMVSKHVMELCFCFITRPARMYCDSGMKYNSRY